MSLLLLASNNPGKLKEMDDFVCQVSSKLDDDTLLVVFGDHGMTEEGDHGKEGSIL